MGCLTVTAISKSSPCHCTASVAEGVGSIKADSRNQNTIIYIKLTSRNESIKVQHQREGDRISVRCGNRNIKVTVTAALACNVGIGEYEFFLVTQGPLIVQDGYFIVKK